MPLTPFHFGLGAAVHAAAPQRVSFLAFCVSNVLIDLESLYNLVTGRHPVHAFFHTYVGCSLVIPVALAFFLSARWCLTRLLLVDPTDWTSPSMRAVAAGAAIGAYSHVVLDSIMHSDISPLSPFSGANALHGVISLGLLHLACVVLGVLGIAGALIRHLIATKDHAG